MCCFAQTRNTLWHRWGAHAAALLALVGLVLMAFWDVLPAGRGLFFRDHLLVFRPRWWHILASFQAGRLPGFTHANPAGVPMETLLNGTYTPGALLFFMADFDTAYDWFVMFHVMLLGVGTWMLARRFHTTVLEALLCGVAASLVGPFLFNENLVVALVGLAYAPWVLVALDMVVVAPSLRAVAWLGLATGFHLQGIMPETLVLDAAGACAVLAVHRPVSWPRWVTAAVAGGMAGLALAAVQLVPVLHGLAGTARGAGFDRAAASAYAVMPLHLVEWVVPSFWNPPDIPFLILPSLSLGHTPFYATTLYLGVLLPLSACSWLEPRGRRAVVIVTGVAVFAALLAMGPTTPLYALVTSLPVLVNGRYPVKYMMLMAAALVVLLPAALRAVTVRPRGLVVAASVYCLVLVAIVGATYSTTLDAFLRSNLIPGPGHPALQDSGGPAQLLEDSMRQHAFHALQFGLGLLLVGAAAAASEKWRRHAPFLCVLVAAGDLAWGAQCSIFGAPVEPHGPPPQILERVANPWQRLYVSGEAQRPLAAHTEGVTFFEERILSGAQRGYDLYRAGRRLRSFDLDGQANPLNARVFGLLQSLSGFAEQRLAARMGAHWLSTTENPNLPGTLPLSIPHERPQFFVPLADARPYVHLYSRWQDWEPHALTNDELMARLLSPETWDVAWVEPGASVSLPPAPVGGCGTPPVVRLDQASTESQLVLHTHSACPALLVALETHVNGWFATVDGVEVPLVTAEAGYLGVVLRDPGDHHVVIRYRDEVSRWAPWSAAALAVMVGVLLVSVVRGRRGQAT